MGKLHSDDNLILFSGRRHFEWGPSIPRVIADRVDLKDDKGNSPIYQFEGGNWPRKLTQFEDTGETLSIEKFTALLLPKMPVPRAPSSPTHCGSQMPVAALSGSRLLAGCPSRVEALEQPKVQKHKPLEKNG